MSRINQVKRFFDSVNINTFSDYIIKNPINYQKKIIFRNEDYEIVLISWDYYAKTNYHNHPKNGCVLKVLSGKLLEYTPEETKILHTNDIGVKNHNEFHQITALEKSYSIHYYSPPGFYN